MLNNKVLLYTLIFFIALVFHLVGLNKIGRTWDEQFKIDMGHIAWDRIAAGDFSLQHWIEGQEHPMVAKYIYGLSAHPEMIRVDNGNGQLKQLTTDEYFRLQSGNFILTGLVDKLFAVSYDLTFPRLLSAVFNSIAVVLTVILSGYILRKYWILLPALVMLLSPRFIVMGQLVTYESLSVMLFCLTAIYFYKLLSNPATTRYYVVVGVLCGMLFWTRYNNAFVFVFLAGWFLLHYLYKRNTALFSWKLLLIPVIAFLLGFLTWPLLWMKFPTHLIDTFRQHETRGIGPSLYFVKSLVATTPIPVLIGLAGGIFFSLRERKYWQSLFVWWFVATMLFFTLLSMPTGGIRYIFTVYPAVAILSAYGYMRMLSGKLVFILIPLLLFMLVDMASYYPYYLDYYNQLVGGVQGAKKSGYEFSWWGEGQREVGYWINDNLPSGSSVGLIVTPKYVFPSIRRDIINKGYVDDVTDADYVVVSYSELQTLSKKFLQNHAVVYEAKVKNESLVLVYKKK